MILSDRTIREEMSSGRLEIDPFDPKSLQPSSVDLTLANTFRIFQNHVTTNIDVRQNQEDLARSMVIDEGQAFILHPGEFVLAGTIERVKLPDDLVARLEGKSSLGRLGLIVHSTAGFVDAGWNGRLTLELLNVLSLPILLYPGMKIAQISFFQMTSPALRPYGSEGLDSKYQGQIGPTPSRSYRDFTGQLDDETK